MSKNQVGGLDEELEGSRHGMVAGAMHEAAWHMFGKGAQAFSMGHSFIWDMVYLCTGTTGAPVPA